MADMIIKPSSGNSLVFQDEGGDAALTVGTTGNTTLAGTANALGTVTAGTLGAGSILNGTRLTDVKSTDGGESAIICDASGYVNHPQNPCFKAYKDSDAFTTSGVTTFPFNQTLVNVGDHYDKSTYKFTAPVAGNYWLHFYAIYQGTSVNGWCGFVFSTGTHKGHSNHFNQNWTNSSSWDSASLSGVFYMAAGCTVHCEVNTITAWHGNDYATFCGWMLPYYNSSNNNPG